ncbi:transposase [Candidatus Micrarchaeota archaeon]|nr:transposase [Candidatus Micrarchaeota archaeon]
MESDFDCKYCHSHKILRWGVRNLREGVVQTYFCGSCRRKFTLANSQVVIDPHKGPRKPITVDERVEELFESNALFPQAEKMDWGNYNNSQMQEKLMFLELLEDLTSLIPDERKRRAGRPTMPLPEMAFAIVAKVYECLSSRRSISDLEIAKRRGYLSKTPHFNTIIKYLNKPELITILKDLIRISAMPLSGFEETVAIDASGLSSAFYSRWVDYRFNKDVKVKDWLKVHVCCGTKTNIVTSIIVTDGHSADSPEFCQLIEETAEGFKPTVVCADKGYAARKNMQTAWDLGIVPFIPFKSNAIGKKFGSQAWRTMYHYFQYDREKFMQIYHRRSNVESTFSMLKRKFQNRLFSRKEVAQTNEALAKVLCHNIVVLIKESGEHGFQIDFNASAHKLPSVHIKGRI